MVSTKKSLSSNIEETNLKKDYEEHTKSEDISEIDLNNYPPNQKGIEKDTKSSGIFIKEKTTDSENDEQVRDKVVDLFDGEIIT